MGADFSRVWPCTSFWCHFISLICVSVFCSENICRTKQMLSAFFVSVRDRWSVVFKRTADTTGKVSEIGESRVVSTRCQGTFEALGPSASALTLQIYCGAYIFDCRKKKNGVMWQQTIRTTYYAIRPICPHLHANLLMLFFYSSAWSSSYDINDGRYYSVSFDIYCVFSLALVFSWACPLFQCHLNVHLYLFYLFRN